MARATVQIRTRRKLGAVRIRQVQATVRSTSNKAAYDFATNVVNNAQRRAPVRTGRLKLSINSQQTVLGSYKIGVDAPYGVYVEYGTRYMAAQPYFRPAIDAEKVRFVEAMRKVFRG